MAVQQKMHPVNTDIKSTPRYFAAFIEVAYTYNLAICGTSSEKLKKRLT